MWHKITLKRVQKAIAFMMLALFFTCTVIPPIVNASAESDKSVVQGSYKKFTGKDTSAENAMGKFGDNSDTSNPNTFGYVFGRLFIPGYMNKVSDYTPAKNSDESMITDGYLCNPKHPNNLVGYNCDLPNISAQILQSVMGIVSPSGVQGNSRQDAEPAFGLGVPSGIPGKKVPVDQNSRKVAYTGLELFGYNLNTTQYNGEWDQINPSTSARLLSNYGTLDKLKVAGSSIWHGTASGFSAYIDNAKLTHPLSWFTAIGNAVEAASSSSLNSILDTSDANVAMAHAWTRPNNLTTSSFYHVYTLTDKQVVDAGQRALTKMVINALNTKLGKSATVQKWVKLQTPPSGFSYDKNKKAHKHDKNAESEKQQLKDWLKSNKQVQAGVKAGIDYGNPSNYNDFKAAWASSAQDQMKSVMNASGGNSLVGKLLKSIMASLAKAYPYGDPSIAISHYVCADNNGSPITNKDGSYKYVYERQNNGDKEYLTPGCSMVRPTVEGGYFGDGYNQKITDTRHISHFHGSIWSLLPEVSNVAGFISTVSTGIIRFISIITNTMMNLSFSPIMKQLGITKIVKVAFTDFSKSVFWPLLILVVAYAGLMMFIDAIRTGGLRKFFVTFFTMLLVFVSAMVVFRHPDDTITYIEQAPLKVDNGLADIILNSNNKQDLCRATGSGTKNGIRSAQCMIWKDTLFDTWTYAQFGTGYNHLFANGTTGLSETQSTMKNKDTDLVGNAKVNLGGGNVINNWAVYQLALMTSGTINRQDTTHPVGQMDNNIYKIVDMQAGPNNAQGRDTRYWNHWTGQNGNRPFVMFCGAILAILSAIAIWGMLITKIELTFLTAVMFIGLPIMLLFGLTPRGQVKLKGYIFTLLGLYAKRLLMVFMLCTMLRVWDAVLGNATNSYTQLFVASATILLFFILYKPHFLRAIHFDKEDLFAGEGLFSGNPHAVREALEKHTPLYIRNKITRMRQNSRGALTGFIGGTLGGIVNGVNEYKIKNAENVLTHGAVHKAIAFDTILRNAKEGAATGVRNNVQFSQRRIGNVLSRKGLSGIEEVSQTKAAIREAAVKDMLSGDNVKSEVAREAFNKSKYGHHYKNDEELSGEISSYLHESDKNIARVVKAVRAARKEVERMKKGKGTVQSISKSSAQLQKIADGIDKSMKRKYGRRNKFIHPIQSIMNEQHVDLQARAANHATQVPTSMKAAAEELKKRDAQQQADKQTESSQENNVEKTRDKIKEKITKKADDKKDKVNFGVESREEVEKSDEPTIRTPFNSRQLDNKPDVETYNDIRDKVKDNDDVVKGPEALNIDDIKNAGKHDNDKQQGPTNIAKNFGRNREKSGPTAETYNEIKDKSKNDDDILNFPNDDSKGNDNKGDDK